MADNTLLNAGAGGNTIATDDVAGVHYQRVKLVDGTLEGTGAIAGDAANGLDVDVTRLPALVAGTANIGDVDVLTLPALPAGTNNIGDVDVLTLPALVAGTANIGDVDVLTLPALVAGTANIGDVDVLTLPALVAGTANIGDVDVLTLPQPLNRTASGALGALNAAVTVASEGVGLVHWEIDTGTLVGTVVFEATLDDTNWFAINAITIAGAVIASVAAFAARGALDSGGYSQVRLRVSAFTSGTSNARLEASVGGGLTRLAQALPAGTNNIGDVDVLTLPALVAGTANIGDVDVLTLPALVAGTAKIGAVDLDSDATIAAAVPTVAQFVAGTDGTNARALKTDAGGELQVDVLTLPALVAGTANIGDVDVLTLPALVAGTANIGDVDVLTLPALVAGTANIGDVDIASFVAGAITEVQGDVAHDAVAAGNPVQMGARANDVDPTAVAAGDATFLWADLFGRQICVLNFPSIVPSDTAGAGAHGPKTVTLTATTDAALVAAPGASLSTYVTSVSASNTSATASRVDIKDGTTIRHSMFLAASGGGFVQQFNPPWKITANVALNGALGTAVTDVRVNVHYYTAP